MTTYSGVVEPWRFFLARSFDLAPMGELLGARSRTLTIDGNRSGSAGFTLGMSDELSASVVPWRTCVLAQRGLGAGAATHWSGPISRVDKSYAAGTVGVSAVGWFEQLMHRLLWEIKKYTAQDASAIVSDLLTYANAQYDTHITEGTFETSQLRDRDYPVDQVIGQAIQELAEIESGFDWYVDPVDRTLNVVARRGEDKPACRWFFIADDRANHGNLTDLSEVQDGTTMVNESRPRGKFSSGLAEDTDSRDYYDILMQEAPSLSDVPNQDILNAYANAEIVYRANPRVTYDVKPRASHAPGVPRFLVDFDLGDTTYLTARRGFHKIEDQAVRVFGVTLSMDDRGVESLSSLKLAAD